MAVTLAVVGALEVAVGLLFFARYLATPVPEILGWQATVAFALGVLTYLAVGALIAASRPNNRIGWLILGVGAVGGAIFALPRVGAYLHYGQGEQVGVLLMAISTVILVPNVGISAVVLPLLFPNGRLPSPRWRPIIWLYLIASSLIIVAAGSADMVLLFGIPNSYRLAIPLAGDIGAVAFSLYIVGVVAAWLSLVQRYRGADGTTQVQIRWYTYAAGVFATAVVGALSASVNTTSIVVVSAAHSLLMMAIGIAILRHHLWEVDLLISRTIVYLGLTAFVGAVYAVGTSALQKVFAGDQRSELAFVLTVFVIVAVFTPVKDFLMHAVDRRFRAAPAHSISDAVLEIARLRDAGAITDTEFETKKQELLARL